MPLGLSSAARLLINERIMIIKNELRGFATRELNTSFLGGSKESSRLGHRSGDLMPSLTSQGKTADYCCFENALLAMNCRLTPHFD